MVEGEGAQLGFANPLYQVIQSISGFSFSTEATSTVFWPRIERPSSITWSL